LRYSGAGKLAPAPWSFTLSSFDPHAVRLREKTKIETMLIKFFTLI
jgi:hypothetical protein